MEAVAESNEDQCVLEAAFGISPRYWAGLPTSVGAARRPRQQKVARPQLPVASDSSLRERHLLHLVEP